MEELQEKLIPTRYKSKISHELSYPVGAERVSRALAGLPQYDEFVLHFNGDPWSAVRTGRYPILRSVYSAARGRMRDQYLDQSGVPFFGGREIAVYAVPRGLRHRIQQYILNTALPEMRAWWESRASSEYDREDVLRFIYDEPKDEFRAETETGLQPQRA